MSQTIHIFKKDVRRFSWEIVLSLLLLALYGWCQPVLWRPYDIVTLNPSTVTILRYTGASSLGLLLGLGWMVMVVRLVYEESLTDDRQFWVTRPYRWHNLLTAKILFLITVINLPLLVVQLCLLATAGFSPFQHFSGLVHLHTGLSLFLLPLVTLAVVTGGRRQMTRAIIVVLIFLVAGLWLGQGLFFVSVSRYPGFGRTSKWEWLGWAVMLGASIVVIVRQYALRKTAQARWILLGAGLVLTLVAAIQPKQQFPIAEYPLVTERAEGYFDINMPPQEKPHAGHFSVNGVQSQGQKVFFISPEFMGGEMAEGLVAELEEIQVILQAPDGSQWTSGWQPVSAVLNHNDSGTTDASGRQSRSIRTFLQVDGKSFDKFKDVPLNLQVVAAATLYRDHHDAAIVPRNREFNIPAVGTCVVSEVSEVNIMCRSPLTRVPFVGVSVRLFRDCAAADDSNAPVYQSYAWWPFADRWGGDFGFSPVNVFSLTATHEVEGQALTTCAASTFTIHQPEKIRLFRVQKEFNGVKLADLIPRE
jgi:hypothetical protein